MLPQIVVEPNDPGPAPPLSVIPARLIPCVPLEVDVTLLKPEVTESAPLARSKALPVPFKVISGVVLFPTVRTPKFTPEAILVPVVLPIVKPRRVLLTDAPASRLIPLVAAATVVTTGFAPPVPGTALLSVEGVTPAIEASVALAP